MRRGLAGTLGAVVALAAIASACGSSGSKASTTTSGPTTTASSGLAAPFAPTGPKVAAPFTLKDQFGKPISLKQYRGKAVLLTFLYVHCPDVCPLITAALKTTTDKLGARAKDVQVIAVSVDPVGDTPKDVRAYLSERGVLHRFQYLVGTRTQLTPIWRDYGIASVPDKKLGREIGHTGIVIGIDAAGKVRGYYPSTPLKPAWMIHDVPLLASTT